MKNTSRAKMIATRVKHQNDKAKRIRYNNKNYELVTTYKKK